MIPTTKTKRDVQPSRIAGGCGGRSLRARKPIAAALTNFCKGKGLVKHLAAKNWASFAHGYNGEAYKDNQYDTRLEEAYRRHAAGT